MKVFWTLLAALAAIPIFAGECQLYYRLDSPKGLPSAQTVGLATKYGEIWGYNIGQDNYEPADWQIGASKPVYKFGESTCSLGLYYSKWDYDLAPKDYRFLIPYAKIAGRFQGYDYAADLNYYVPLNGGPHLLTSTDLHLEREIISRVSIGLTGQYTEIEGLSKRLTAGPRLSYVCNRSELTEANITLSYLRFGPDDPNTLRAELAVKFK